MDRKPDQRWLSTFRYRSVRRASASARVRETPAQDCHEGGRVPRGAEDVPCLRERQLGEICRVRREARTRSSPGAAPPCARPGQGWRPARSTASRRWYSNRVMRSARRLLRAQANGRPRPLADLMNWLVREPAHIHVGPISGVGRAAPDPGSAVMSSPSTSFRSAEPLRTIGAAGAPVTQWRSGSTGNVIASG